MKSSILKYKHTSALFFTTMFSCISLQQTATAQDFPADKVQLYKHFDLAALNTTRGNDCWGYVSGSGREYAIMGVKEQAIFVEITDPANAVIIASIPHTASNWGDYKVYQDHAYVVNEEGGGIQIIDLSDIDNGNVSLIGSINAPSRSHNIAVDTNSGFLYTCGSRGGAATTVIYSLTDPANPVQVGTWGDAYLHDAQPFTYTKGEYAGRQILFGSSTDNGLDVIDVTNKSNVQLLSRTGYTNVSYSHQSWTEDGRYVFLDDELDSIPRTTIYDCADLSNPVVIGEFNSGLASIDHNLYVKNGFIFEANYTSGLRIFDASDPVNPVQVGYFDTYPESNEASFLGAWSTYPYFPSGTVIVSDKNRGLFILDPSEAVGSGSTSATLTGVTVVNGKLINGGLPELLDSDDAYFHTRSGFGQTLVDLHNMEMIVNALTTVDTASTIDLSIESRVDESAGLAQIRLHNWNTNQFDSVGSYSLGNTDQVDTIKGIGTTNYVDSGGNIDLSIKHLVFVPFLAFSFESWIDRVEIVIR